MIQQEIVKEKEVKQVTLREAAEISRLSFRTIQNYMQSGRIQRFNHPSIGLATIDKEKFVQFLQNGVWPD